MKPALQKKGLRQDKLSENGWTIDYDKDETCPTEKGIATLFRAIDLARFPFA